MSSPKIYTVSFAGVAVTAQQDLIAVVAGSTKTLSLLAFELSQSTEVGDTAEEGLSILVKRGATVAGSGGSGAFTPIPCDSGQGASSFTSRLNDTTPAGTGTIVNLHATNWNVRSSPTLWVYTPEMTFGAAPSERIVIGLATTPADSITMSGTAWLSENG